MIPASEITLYRMRRFQNTSIIPPVVPPVVIPATLIYNTTDTPAVPADTTTVIDGVILPGGGTDYVFKSMGHIDYSGLSIKHSRRGGMSSCSFTTINNIEKDDFIIAYKGSEVIFYGSVQTSNKNKTTIDGKFVQPIECTNTFLSDFQIPNGSNFSPQKGLPLAFILNVIKVMLVSSGIPSGMIDFDLASTYNVKLDSDSTNLFSFFDNLSNELPAAYCWGVSPTKIYFKKVNDTPFIINEDNINTIDRNQRSSDQKIFTAISYSGGSAKYPQMIQNGSFETYNYADVITVPTFNELPESIASFETGWTLAGGATRKAKGGSGTDETKPRTGTYVIEIDRAGESATETFSMFKIVPGARYTFSFWYQPEPLVDLVNPAVVKCTVSWLNAGGAVILTDQFFTNPETVSAYFNVQSLLYAPPNADKIRIAFVGTSGAWGNDKGIHLDDVVVVKTDNIYPDQWKIFTNGTTRIDLAHLDFGVVASHGITSMYIESANASTGNKVFLINNTQIQCKPGEAYKICAKLSSVAGKTFPSLDFIIESWKAGASPSDPPVLVATLTSAGPALSDNKWHNTELLFRVPRDTLYCVLKIAQKSAGAWRIDAVSFRDFREQTSYWYDNTVRFNISLSELDAINTFGTPTNFGNTVVKQYGQGRYIEVQGNADTIVDTENIAYGQVPNGINEVIAYAKANAVFDYVPDITYNGDAFLDVQETISLDGVKKYILEEFDFQVNQFCMQKLTLQFPTPKIEALAKLMIAPQKNVR